MWLRWILFYLVCISFQDLIIVGLENLALNKPALQINDYKTHHTASVAVDGNASFCSHTQSTTGPVPNWWMVDLEANYKITNVNVLNRGDCCVERLQNFTISVWEYDPGPHIKYNMTANEFCICATQLTAVPGGQWANLTCTKKCVGRFVLLMSYYNDHLTLCEVQVFGNPYSGCSAYLPLEKYIRKIEGKRANPNCAFSPFQVSNEYECSHQCLQTYKCVSFNYSPQIVNGVNCQLIKCFSHPVKAMISDSNWNWRYISL